MKRGNIIMADKKKPYYKANPKTMTITVDLTVKPTKDDEEMVSIYMKNGYKLRKKSQARAEAARKRAKASGFGKKKEETKE